MEILDRVAAEMEVRVEAYSNSICFTREKSR
jgi:hypothetical protein